MIQLLARRIVVMLLTLVAALTLVFALIHASGDPLDGLLAPGASEDVRAQAAERVGLDRPLAVQYVTFLGRARRGDFGDSWRSRQPALETVLDRLPATLNLAGATIVVATVGGLALGLIAASTRLWWLQFLVRGAAFMGQAIPAFWLGTLGIVLFAVRLGWLPSSGNDSGSSLILPVLTLSAYPGSLIARLTLSSVRDVRSRPFVTQARAKGLSDRVVLLRHILPNSVMPVLAIVGVEAGYLAGGTILVESVFAYPGIGRLAMQATADRDLPVIQAFVAVTVVMISLVSLITDLAAGTMDPSVRGSNSTATVSHA